jgi:hypothetical protein
MCYKRARVFGVSVSRVKLAGLAVVVALVVSAAAAASPSGVGYDISFPQCNVPFPTAGAFGIVGVNGGRPFGANPCLGTGSGPSELAWAGMSAQLYANTADPGPALSSRWPNGQVSPKPCNTAANPGADTPECHYDYGWNAAADSYLDAVAAYVSLGWATAGATRTPVANQWWLDVESANSWTQGTSLNVQALQGEVDYLHSAGAAGVGFYANVADWQTITGNTTGFVSSPTWLAGASSLADAQSRCGGSGFTGGGVALVQFLSGGFDNDYRCVSQLGLVVTPAAQTLIAGVASAPLYVLLPQPATAAVTVSLGSSSASGSFAVNPSGPWSSTLTLQVAVGAGSTAGFYYSDTRAGSPVLTASASTYTSGTQTETVTPAALASLTISPGSARVHVGQSQAFSATGADRYGNPVTASPNWSVSPTLGKFAPNPSGTTTFTAAAIGNGTITATSNGVVGTAAITVLARKRPSTALTSRQRPSLRVRPTVVSPGERVWLSGNAGTCERGEKVYLLSRAFPEGHGAGLGAITTRVRARGVFSATGLTRPTAPAGRYTITARCDGSNIGATTQLQIT